MDRRSFLGGMLLVGGVGEASCAPDRVEPSAETAATEAAVSVRSRADDLLADLRRAAGRGGGDVEIPEGRIQVGETLPVGDGVNLYLGRAAALVPAVDVPVVQLMMGGRLGGGGTIDASMLPRFSHAAVHLEGVADWGTANHHTTIHDLRIRGRYQEGGTGIHLRAVGQGNSVSFVKAWGVDVQRMYYGIRLEAVNDSGEGVAWVNGNRFDVDVAGAVYGIHLTAEQATARVNGNWFRSQIQSVPEMRRAVYNEGSYNEFELMVWDWNEKRAGYPDAVEFGREARRSRVRVASLPRRTVLDRGRANLVELP